MNNYVYLGSLWEDCVKYLHAILQFSLPVFVVVSQHLLHCVSLEGKVGWLHITAISVVIGPMFSRQILARVYLRCEKSHSLQ